MKNLDLIYSWSIKELWNYFNQIMNDEDDKGITLKQLYINEYNIIKYGSINKKGIPIHYINNEWYDLYPDHKIAIIRGFGKVNIDELLDEIDNREQLMRKIIIENTDEEDIHIDSRQ